MNSGRGWHGRSVIWVPTILIGLVDAVLARKCSIQTRAFKYDQKQAGVSIGRNVGFLFLLWTVGFRSRCTPRNCCGYLGQIFEQLTCVMVFMITQFALYYIKSWGGMFLNVTRWVNIQVYSKDGLKFFRANIWTPDLSCRGIIVKVAFFWTLHAG